MRILSSYNILHVVLTTVTVYFYKKVLNLDKTAQNVIYMYDVTNDITVLLLLDFNKCEKIVKKKHGRSFCDID